MYAVVETGGKQYKVAKKDIILVEKLTAKENGSVKLDKVLLAKDKDSIYVGTPYLTGAHVVCDLIGAVRGDKVTAYKYKRRKSEKKKIGHRQELVRLQVKEIEIK